MNTGLRAGGVGAQSSLTFLRIVDQAGGLSCMQLGAKCAAGRTPFHGLMGAGERQRRGPIGGSAKGTRRHSL